MKTLAFLCSTALLACLAMAQAPPKPAYDGAHDFDFELGKWHTHLRRRLNPLTGSNTWIEMDGTSIVRPLLSGRANIVELVADGAGRHIEAVSLRLYHPESKLWDLPYANAASGELTQPTVGEFRIGRGEFYDQEPIGGRATLVKFIISDITPDSAHFEQSFSDDGGKTWEVNWIAAVVGERLLE